MGFDILYLIFVLGRGGLLSHPHPYSTRTSRSIITISRSFFSLSKVPSIRHRTQDAYVIPRRERREEEVTLPCIRGRRNHHSTVRQ
jgi:hypothetical protein